MKGEAPVVPAADFHSYYGRPVIKAPVWRSPDIPGYLFLGGLAGASSTLALGAHITNRTGLARPAKLGAAAAIGLSLFALVRDLGRPDRFYNLLRVFKPTSPMSVGSWLLAAYGPLAMTAAGSELTGAVPAVGSGATLGAAALGPAVAAYTAALLSDTAVPAWHEGHRIMPFVFTSSA
ncbi:MAG TPA: NrfD/PsrC family molybdoenzyme membrane anchor subunit, partial [Acidimicrobiales bacterium]|nr:NrfD/PsrC family molybdoenzyme membrane anchor subunit [Acidimicrobiales bacterium]